MVIKKINYSLSDLLMLTQGYSKEEIIRIEQAYSFASHAHRNQKRKSGDPYIVHPTSVACILAEHHADADTIIAGLLHDVVEDCDIPLDLIEEKFGTTVRVLVDGVTKIKKEDAVNYKDENLKKIMDSFFTDARIFIIKLADRLHNMRTMEYMSKEKRIRKAVETREVYVHTSYLLGEYGIKNELEDYAFKYEKPEEYARLKRMYKNYCNKKQHALDTITIATTRKLAEMGVDHTIELNLKHLNGVYRRLPKYGKINKIDDLASMKITTNSIEECYKTREIIKKFYETIPDKSKDYIETPKTNRYMALHETAYDPTAGFVQFQFVTPQMNAINTRGITEYWDFKYNNNEEEAVEKQMQEVIEDMQFFKFLKRDKEEGLPTDVYVDEIRSDILSKMIYVVNGAHKTIEIPEKSVALDYVFRVDPKNAPYVEKMIVDGRIVPLDYKLDNKKEITYTIGDKIIDVRKAYNMCNTHYAKRKINELIG